MSPAERERNRAEASENIGEHALIPMELRLICAPHNRYRHIVANRDRLNPDLNELSAGSCRIKVNNLNPIANCNQPIATTLLPNCQLQ